MHIWGNCEMDNILIAIILSYLCGSIPFGLILANVWGNGKLREQGSGNIGSTNVLRTQGRLLGALTLLLDLLKAFLVVFLYKDYDFSVVVFATAIIGHLYPIWLKFRGGKGVAAFLGGMLALNPMIGGICLATWLLVFIVFKISSVSGLSACIVGAILAIINFISDINNCSYINICLMVIVCLLIIFKHKDNIKRLLEHKECGISIRKQN